MPFVILPTNSASGGYDITNSLRFNSGSSDNLARTPSSTTNTKTWTWSGWVKRANLGSFQLIFGVNNGTNDSVAFELGFNGSDQLVGLPWNFYFFTTNAVFRDTSAWYHIVFAFDTTQATSTNRFKVYVNGVEITSFASTSYPSLNSDWVVNTTASHRIGIVNYVSAGGLNRPFNGYVSDVYLIDGQQLTPSSFGETDEDTGIWKPKAFSGSYGTNGFYLQFKNSASLGTDSSGNGNTFTVNNLTSIDQTTDTPTNNFCTMNPLNSTNSCLLTEGNLKQAQSSNDQVSNSNIGFNKGKWYWEFKVVSGLGEGGIVLNTNKTYYSSRATADLTTNNTCIGRIFNATGSTNNMRIMGSLGSSSVGASVTYSAGDIVSVAVDADAGKIWFAKNGTYEGSGNPATGSNPTYDWSSNLSSVDFITAIYGIFSGTSPSAEWNFGNPIYSSGSFTDGAGFGNFSYAVPSGYYSLNTRNLATFG